MEEKKELRGRGEGRKGKRKEGGRAGRGGGEEGRVGEGGG